MANWADALKTAKGLASSANSKTNGYASNIAIGIGSGALLGGAYGGLSDNGSVMGGMIGGAALGGGIGGGVKYIGTNKKVGMMTDAVTPATNTPTSAPLKAAPNLPSTVGEASPVIKGMSAGNDLSYIQKPSGSMMNDANYNASGSVAASRAKMANLISKQNRIVDYSPVKTIDAPNWTLQDKAYSNSIDYS